MITRRALLPMCAAGLIGTTLPARVLSAQSGDWQRASVPFEARQVSKHCWVVIGRTEMAGAANQGFMSNAGFIVTPDGVIVIDALATPGLSTRLIDEIRSKTSAPIQRVILTHYHADHSYGVIAFQRLGIPVDAWQTARATAGSDTSELRRQERVSSLGPWLGSGFRVPQPDRWLARDESVELGGLTISLRHVGPAHSPDDLIVIVEPDGVVFTGDLFYAGRVPYVGEESNTRRWLSALDTVETLPALQLIPGHGPVSAEPSKDIESTRRYLNALRAEMGRAVTDLEEFEVAYAKADFSAFDNEPAFDVANRINAYNVYLEMERESLESVKP